MSFYVILPSNTSSSNNKTNSYKVRLPRTLRFDSEWHVGLAVMLYPHSWPTMGTREPQFIDVYYHHDKRIRHTQYGTRYTLKSTNITSLEELELLLNSSFHDRTKVVPSLANAGAAAVNKTDITEHSLEQWEAVFKNPSSSIHFTYRKSEHRFHVKLDSRFVERIVLSEQLSYVLGFWGKRTLYETALAGNTPDLRGGISAMYVYAPDLIEPLIVGDTLAPVLRVVNVQGKKNEYVEESFVSIQYHRLLLKEITEISIEIHTPTGVLVPFEWGFCTLTLHFKKKPYF
jgi:hypothetical protein